jgi:hypothetical protein
MANQTTNCAGECIYEDFTLEYVVISLEYIRNKSMKIEAVCYNRRNSFDKEAVFKHSTNNLNILDDKLRISYSIMDSVIKNMDLQKDKLYKLIIKNGGVFYLCAV